MNNESIGRRKIETIAGLSAGFVTTLVFHPLDLIKIRLQLLKEPSRAPFSSIAKVLSEINKSAITEYANYNSNNIILKQYKFPHTIIQCYRGIAPNLIGNITAWSLYFTIYAELKGIIHTSNKTVDYFTSSTLTGLTCSVITNPIWVLKTRILGSSKYDVYAYKSLRDGISQIYQREGIAGFWKGTTPSMLQVFQASIQLTLYDHSKNFFTSRHNTSKLSTTEYIYSSALSKVLSMTLMYPIQVLKTRLQSYNPQNEKRGIISVAKGIWGDEGRMRGFYKGFGANILRVVPATCVTFVTYETVKNYLSYK
ncbi:uncharacterized protein PRCAT00003356001 [Priceomyces carsonii]|uniref:uncharacterized protein n=1 Tax=Priceomyces carsonii TaxID=28549 RepID=UPI002EDA64D6|nr:unnamed protein product [Priceomyces carsonii]